MASLELIKRAIASGRVYDDLPPRIKNMIPPNEWKVRVKEHCIQRGLPWASSLACTVSGQQEYYDELMRSYKTWMRLFPYHLSDYLCRVARITPFKYYLDMMANILKEERSYDRVPNFTAADALSVLGIGRNEYISALNSCKARRLLWRVNINRDGIVREQLPQEPTSNQRLEPWWRVAVVNIGESEYRELGEEELANLKTAALPASVTGGDIRVRDFQPDVLRGLLRRGLAYIEVPVKPEDRFAIPPLEGFVSNKTSEAGDAAADPLEALLYSVFVANSERMTVAELGAILGVELADLQAAIGVASRLGFATRVTDFFSSSGSSVLPGRAGDEPWLAGLDAAAGGAAGDGVLGSAAAGGGAAAAAADDGDDASVRHREQRSLQLAERLLGASSGGSRGGGVAVVVDAEATGYLMMGALSPGLKRHSVTLFEGGRVAGEQVMKELVSELWASFAAGQGFEGEMLRLTHYAAALATLLEAVRVSAGPELPLELLRKESLAGLSPATACKVLNHAYCAVVPISPLPPPVLPLSPYQPGPAYYGPTPEAASPWLQLALYSAARCGPLSYVFVCGQRVWRLPHPLDRCTHALLTPWDEDTEHGRLRTHSSEGQMMVVEASFLLYTLNELLSCTAVLVQPLDCTEPNWSPEVVDVPLPLPAAVVTSTVSRSGVFDASSVAPLRVPAVRQANGERLEVCLPPVLVSGLHRLGLVGCVGHLRLMRMRGPPLLHPHGAAGTHQAHRDQPSNPHHHHHQHPPHHKQRPRGPPQPQQPLPGPGSGQRGPLQGLQQAPPPGAAVAVTVGSGRSAGADPGGGAGAGGTPSAVAVTVVTGGGSNALPAAPQANSQKGAEDVFGARTAMPTPAGGGDGAVDGGGAAGDGSSAGGGGSGDGGGDGAWLPLSVHLGVPLYSLELCRAVCRAAEAEGFLTPRGRHAQLQSAVQLQNQLTKLLVQYSHCALDGGYGSAGTLPRTGDLPTSEGEAAAGSYGGGANTARVVQPSGGGSAASSVAAGPTGGSGTAAGGVGARVGLVVPLPALNLSFDGNSLQPIRLQDSVQGLGCLCQA